MFVLHGARGQKVFTCIDRVNQTRFYDLPAMVLWRVLTFKASKILLSSGGYEINSEGCQPVRKLGKHFLERKWAT